MADDSMLMSQAEISALKETLFSQQELLQRLHHELDAEREAAATAASEALSMILRLQGEKASVKMEAEQYKRLAEERMCHAEESFAVIEDIIQEREMEVAALDHQVQTYRCKLLSMGCDDPCDPCDDDLEFPENSRVNDTGSLSLRRRNSEPVLVKYKEALLDGLSSSPGKAVIPVEETPGDETDSVLDSEKKADNSNQEGSDLYGEKIKELSLRVQQMIAGDNSSNTKNGTRTPPYVPSRDLTVLNEVAVVADVKRTISPGKSSNEGEPLDSHCPPSVLDVFEVPQADDSCLCGQSSTDGKRKEVSQNSEICDGKVLAHPETVKIFTKEENDWLKKLLESTHDEKHLCKPSQVAAIERGVVVEPATSVTEPASIGPPSVKRTTTTTGIADPAAIELAVIKPATHVTESAVVKPATSVSESTANERAVIKPAKRTAVIEHAGAEPGTSSAVQPATSVTEFASSSNQMNRNSETNEIDTLAQLTNRETELKMLKEIKAKLNLLQAEIRGPGEEKSSRRDLSCFPLPEAMLYFWL